MPEGNVTTSAYYRIARASSNALKWNLTSARTDAVQAARPEDNKPPPERVMEQRDLLPSPNPACGAMFE